MPRDNLMELTMVIQPNAIQKAAHGDVGEGKIIASRMSKLESRGINTRFLDAPRSVWKMKDYGSGNRELCLPLAVVAK